jgi:8-oxo-dGTP pyrophosphatase MutT (NUDIX family)
MDEIATYYVTLQPIREGAKPAFGMRNIAFVNDPAIEEVGVYLNIHDTKKVVDSDSSVKILDYLKTVGIVKPSNWVEVTDEEYLSAREINLGIEDSESYNDVQKKGGGGQWLVRYEYTGPSDTKTREFCSDVLNLGKLYTEEEIVNGLSNPEFGNYNIFDYKGSYGCRHKWKRQIYFEDYEDDEVRKVGFVPQVSLRLNDRMATTLNAYLSSDEKMQVCAALLIPEKKIFRNDGIGRYNMVFSKETILEMHNIALSNGSFEKGNLFKDTHHGDVAPSYVLDSWIIEDANDKAYIQYKLKNLPIGTLVVLSQVTDKIFWENEIKQNKKYAYSIEALINLSIIKLSVQQYGDVIVYNDKGEFLLLQRHAEDDYEPNKLCFAGGKIEEGEDIKKGALRELLEETGIKSNDADFIDSIKNSDGTISNYFQVKTNQEFKPSNEHKGYSWVTSLDNFSDDMFIENDKKRLVQIINKSKMEKDQIVLPDGEHLINGTIYIVKDGVVTETKEVTPDQEAIIEDVAKEELAVEEVPVTDKKPIEEKLEEVPTVEATPATEAPIEDDRLAKLEATQEDLIAEIAKLKGELEAPKLEDLPVSMSDNRPMWRRISDGLNAIKNK